MAVLISSRGRPGSLTKRFVRIACLYCILSAVFMSVWTVLSLRPSFIIVDVIGRTLATVKLTCAVIAVQNAVFWRVVLVNRAKIYNLLKCAVIVIAATFCFHVITVLYGAPLRTHTAETFHFSMLLSVTAILPCCCALGPNFNTWIKVILQSSPEPGPETMVYIICISSIVGVWLGAFFIPLDWDRPWQAWPITCVTGNLIGYISGLVINFIHLASSYKAAPNTKHKSV